MWSFRPMLRVCSMFSVTVLCTLIPLACESEVEDTPARCDSTAEGVELNLNLDGSGSSGAYSYQSGGGNIALTFTLFGNDGLLAFIGEQLYPPVSGQPADLVMRVPDGGGLESGWYCSNAALYTERETQVGPNAENVEFTASDLRALGQCPGAPVSGSAMLCELECSQQANLVGTIDGVDVEIDSEGLYTLGMVSLKGGGFVWYAPLGDVIARGLIRLPSDSGPPVYICIEGGDYVFGGPQTLTGLSTLGTCEAAVLAGDIEGCSLF